MCRNILVGRSSEQWTSTPCIDNGQTRSETRETKVTCDTRCTGGPCLRTVKDRDTAWAHPSGAVLGMADSLPPAVALTSHPRTSLFSISFFAPHSIIYHTLTFAGTPILISFHHATRIPADKTRSKFLPGRLSDRSRAELSLHMSLCPADSHQSHGRHLCQTRIIRRHTHRLFLGPDHGPQYGQTRQCRRVPIFRFARLRVRSQDRRPRVHVEGGRRHGSLQQAHALLHKRPQRD